MNKIVVISIDFIFIQLIKNNFIENFISINIFKKYISLMLVNKKICFQMFILIILSKNIFIN